MNIKHDDRSNNHGGCEGLSLPHNKQIVLVIFGNQPVLRNTPNDDPPSPQICM